MHNRHDITLPLGRAGVCVDGIELWQDMLDRLREKPADGAVEVTVGDMSRVTTGRTYRLVYLVCNTIGNLLSQDDQVRCFENAARHLTDDGVFVLECRIPTAPAQPGHQFVDVEEIDLDHVGLGACCYDPVSQVLDDNQVVIGADSVLLSPIRLRLAHPPEFDLMARIAGLRLREVRPAGTVSRSRPAAGDTSVSTSRSLAPEDEPVAAGARPSHQTPAMDPEVSPRDALTV